MDPHEFVEHVQLRPAIVLTGTAKEGKSGPPVGLVDIGISAVAYLFRISLPGVRKDQCNVKCDIQRDGKVHVHGVITSGGVLRDSPSVYQIRVQQLCTPGPFSVCFNLPGPVDPRLSSPNFRSDGILEVIVMKYRASGF
ncbi:increased DNA methylation 3 [Malania oleifera]|uniref:increased DNA methylation 3 n=1 Tax=Malania oleifera TaxID=397392 RepID=UPI0025AEB2ED|nr:increased DNA methylation 3 [Malania oleifera]